MRLSGMMALSLFRITLGAIIVHCKFHTFAEINFNTCISIIIFHINLVRLHLTFLIVKQVFSINGFFLITFRIIIVRL